MSIRLSAEVMPPEDRMNKDLFSDAKIIRSWCKNATPWTVAVREKQIESRKQITDQAIIDAILSCSPSRRLLARFSQRSA